MNQLSRPVRKVFRRHKAADRDVYCSAITAVSGSAKCNRKKPITLIRHHEYSDAVRHPESCEYLLRVTQVFDDFKALFQLIIIIALDILLKARQYRLELKPLKKLVCVLGKHIRKSCILEGIFKRCVDIDGGKCLA